MPYMNNTAMDFSGGAYMMNYDNSMAGFSLAAVIPVVLLAALCLALVYCSISSRHLEEFLRKSRRVVMLFVYAAAGYFTVFVGQIIYVIGVFFGEAGGSVKVEDIMYFFGMMVLGFVVVKLVSKLIRNFNELYLTEAEEKEVLE